MLLNLGKKESKRRGREGGGRRHFTAGAWGDAAQKTLTLCAQRIPVPRRGLVMGLWRQFLSVTFQKEQNRVMCHKVVSSLRTSSLEVDVDDILSDLYDLLPCFSE